MILRTSRFLLAPWAALGMVLAAGVLAKPASVEAVFGADGVALKAHLPSAGDVELWIMPDRAPARIHEGPPRSWHRDEPGTFSRVQQVRLWIQGRPVPLPLSAFADGYGPDKARLWEENGRLRLWIRGGDGGATYETTFRFVPGPGGTGYRLAERASGTGPFPDQVWERTVWVAAPPRHQDGGKRHDIQAVTRQHRLLLQGRLSRNRAARLAIEMAGPGPEPAPVGPGPSWERVSITRQAPVQAVDLLIGNKQVLVPYSAFADLHAVARACIRERNGRLVLQVEGGEGAQAFEATFTLLPSRLKDAGYRVSERTLRRGPARTGAWERTVYHNTLWDQPGL